jgi:hypothetical protein
MRRPARRLFAVLKFASGACGYALLVMVGSGCLTMSSGYFYNVSDGPLRVEMFAHEAFASRRLAAFDVPPGGGHKSGLPGCADLAVSDPSSGEVLYALLDTNLSDEVRYTGRPHQTKRFLLSRSRIVPIPVAEWATWRSRVDDLLAARVPWKPCPD